jgi:hypothetical protein
VAAVAAAAVMGTTTATATATAGGGGSGISSSGGNTTTAQWAGWRQQFCGDCHAVKIGSPIKLKPKTLVFRRLTRY